MFCISCYEAPRLALHHSGESEAHLVASTDLPSCNDRICMMPRRSPHVVRGRRIHWGSIGWTLGIIVKLGIIVRLGLMVVVRWLGRARIWTSRVFVGVVVIVSDSFFYSIRSLQSIY
jgi:hypothetical protein